MHPRKDPRLPAAYKARLIVPSRNRGKEVWIKDVSEQGMKLLDVPRIEAGTRVLITIDDIRVEGEIRWWNDLRAGVVLDRKLTRDEIATIRHMRVRNWRPARHPGRNAGAFRELH